MAVQPGEDWGGGQGLLAEAVSWRKSSRATGLGTQPLSSGRSPPGPPMALQAAGEPSQRLAAQGTG